MKKNKKNSFFYYILLFLNFLAAIILIVTYLTKYFSPEKYQWLPFLSLCYPYILLLNIAFVFFWLLCRRKAIFISLLCIVLGWSSFAKWVQFSGKTKDNNKNYAKILIYNVQVLGLYQDRYGLDTNRRDSILTFLEDENPDIICFQEYYQNSKNGKFKTTSLIDKQHKFTDTHFYFPINRNNNMFGLATFSTYPIINKGIIDFHEDKSSNHAIFSDIVLKTDTLRVYNIHLQSIFLGEEDYLFAKQYVTTLEMSNKEIKKGTFRIMKKLQQGSVKRAKQAQILKKHIAQSPYKVIVCGDFNDVPWSYTYSQVSHQLKDAFVESGKGLGKTLKIDEKLAFRIDYILHSKDIKSCQFETKNYVASDHLPITTLIELSE